MAKRELVNREDRQKHDDHCKSPFQTHAVEIEQPAVEAKLATEKENLAEEETLVLAISVPGEFYAEDVEWRRNVRYAVGSALHRAGFVPAVENHIGYFLFCPSEKIALSQPRETGSLNPGRPEHLNSAALKNSKKSKINQEAELPQMAMNGRSMHSRQSENKGESCSEENERWPHIVVPYEWFSKSFLKKKRVLLLWVNEDMLLGDQPLQKLSSL